MKNSTRVKHFLQRFILPMALTTVVTTVGSWFLHGMPLYSHLRDAAVTELILSYGEEEVSVTDPGQRSKVLLGLSSLGLFLPCDPPQEPVYTYRLTFPDGKQAEYCFSPGDKEHAGCALWGNRWFSTREMVMDNILAQWSQDALRSPNRVP